MIVAVLLVALALVWALRRRRKSTLSGRNSERPIYSVEPPSRRVGARKREAL
jgi:hypothetical protein